MFFKKIFLKCIAKLTSKSCEVKNEPGAGIQRDELTPKLPAALGHLLSDLELLF